MESSHAVAYAMRRAKGDAAGGSILVCLSGRGDKDIDYVGGALWLWGSVYGLIWRGGRRASFLAEGGFRMMVIPPITKQYRILVYNWNIGCPLDSLLPASFYCIQVIL